MIPSSSSSSSSYGTVLSIYLSNYEKKCIVPQTSLLIYHVMTLHYISGYLKTSIMPFFCRFSEISVRIYHDVSGIIRMNQDIGGMKIE